VRCEGRWGPRGLPDAECCAILTAEAVYTEILRGRMAATRPEDHGTADFGRAFSCSVRWEIRPNAVWRFGRVFLVCPRCDHHVTRVYVPSERSDAAVSVGGSRTAHGRTATSVRDGPHCSGRSVNPKRGTRGRGDARLRRLGRPSAAKSLKIPVLEMLINVEVCGPTDRVLSLHALSRCGS